MGVVEAEAVLIVLFTTILSTVTTPARPEPTPTVVPVMPGLLPLPEVEGCDEEEAEVESFVGVDLAEEEAVDLPTLTATGTPALLLQRSILRECVRIRCVKFCKAFIVFLWYLLFEQNRNKGTNSKHKTTLLLVSLLH